MARYIISGGGTGGHIFPALAIADGLKQSDPNAEILFVGASGRMEMERVPASGYDIIGLDIMGIQRRLTLKNLKVPFKLIGSLWKASRIIKDFKPDVAIGVGGYASGPLLRMAARQGIPTVIQEQNSFPGITNKLLAKGAQRILVAYEGMHRFFPKERIRITGNPVRKNVLEVAEVDRASALAHFDLTADRPVLLIIGGSLGARSMNHAMAKHLDSITGSGVQVLWQTGKTYYERMSSSVSEVSASNTRVVQFIDRMDLAYSAADVILSRAGALSISELCVVGKPVVLVPSPNVSEDHQTKNARALVEKGAAILLPDSQVDEDLWNTLEPLFRDEIIRKDLSSAIGGMARPLATQHIVEEIMQLTDA